FLAVSGLLDRREQDIRREKLTGLALHQTALGRLIGQWYLVGKQAGSREQGTGRSQTQFLVPGMRRDDLGMIARLMPGFSVPPGFNAVSRRLRSLLWMRLAAVALTAVALGWWFLPAARPLLAVFLVVL